MPQKTPLDDRIQRVARNMVASGATSGTFPEAILMDMLMDLRQWCAVMNMDFDEVSERSRVHYEAECEMLIFGRASARS